MSALRRARARVRMAVRRRIKGPARPFGTEAPRRQKQPFTITPPREKLPTFDVVILARRTARALGAVLAVAARILQRFEPAVRVLYTLPVVIAAGVVAAGARSAAGIWDGLMWLDRALRPEWVIGAVVIAAAAGVGLAQFVHYAGIQVDSLSYGGRLKAVAPPPETGFRDTGSAHAYALLPVAAVAVLLVPVAIRGNWRFGRLIALCGVAVIAVSLIVDLPKGLDTGRLGVSYVGVNADLSDGFYAQIAAGATLLLSGLLLSSVLRRREPARAPRRRRARRPARAPRPSLPSRLRSLSA